MQITIPNRVAIWLRESEDPERPELTRDLRIQLSSGGSEHHPARITAIASLWHDVPDQATGRVRALCLCDAEGRDLERALTRLERVLTHGT